MEQQISEPVTLTFTHSEKEYVAAMRLFYAHVYHTRFRMVLSSIVLSFGLILVLLNLEVIFGSAVALVGLIFLLINSYAHLVTPLQYFRHNAMFRDEFNLRFSEDGLLFRYKDAESKLAWSFYSKVWETPRFYFLRYDNFFTLIPKRVFTNKVQESAFRNLLRRRISEYSEAKRYWRGEIGGFQGEYQPPQSPPDWR